MKVVGRTCKLVLNLASCEISINFSYNYLSDHRHGYLVNQSTNRWSLSCKNEKKVVLSLQEWPNSKPSATANQYRMIVAPPSSGKTNCHSLTVQEPLEALSDDINRDLPDNAEQQTQLIIGVSTSYLYICLCYIHWHDPDIASVTQSIFLCSATRNVRGPTVIKPLANLLLRIEYTKYLHKCFFLLILTKQFGHFNIGSDLS